MTVSCPSYADTHALDWARAVSAESPHRFQMMHAPAGGPALACRHRVRPQAKIVAARILEVTRHLRF